MNKTIKDYINKKSVWTQKIFEDYKYILHFRAWIIKGILIYGFILVKKEEVIKGIIYREEQKEEYSKGNDFDAELFIFKRIYDVHAVMRGIMKTGDTIKTLQKEKIQL